MFRFFTSIYDWLGSDPGTDRVLKVMDKIPFGDSSKVDEGGLVVLAFVTVALALLIAYAFYIKPINHPKFKAWWAWLIMLAINAAIAFGAGCIAVDMRLRTLNNHLKNSDALKKAIDEDLHLLSSKGNIAIGPGDLIDFAMGNMWWGCLCFVACSALLMWFSTNARMSPFRN